MASRGPPPPRVDRDGFAAVSDAAAAWDDRTAALGLQDVRYAVAPEGIAKITINLDQAFPTPRIGVSSPCMTSGMQ